MRCSLVQLWLAGAILIEARPLERSRRWVVLPNGSLPTALVPSPPQPASLLPTISQETVLPTPAFTYSAVGFNAAPSPAVGSASSGPRQLWSAPANLSSVAEVQSAFNISSWSRGDNASSLVASGIGGMNSSALVASFPSTDGLAFVAQPLNLFGTSNLSFAYSVYLDKSFDFSRGGVLPGLFAGQANCSTTSAAGPECLLMSVNFDANGSLSLNASLPATATTSNSTLPTGRWARLQQDVAMNDTCLSVRLWLDQTLVSTWSESAISKRKRCLFDSTTTSFMGIWHDVLLDQSSTSDARAQRIYVSQHSLAVWA